MKIQKYEIKTNKDIDEKRIATISNINITPYMDRTILNSIINNLILLNPTHIMIPGNLYIAKGDALTLSANKTIIIDFLKKLSDIADIYISLGRYEFLNGKYKKYQQYLYNDVKSVDVFSDYYKINKPIRFLGQFTDHKIISTNDLNIVGLNQNYNEEKCVKRLIQKYEQYLGLLEKEIDENKFNILLAHNPIIIDAYNKLEVLKKFDLILTTRKKSIKNNIINGDTSIILSNGVNSYPYKKERTIEFIKIKK